VFCGKRAKENIFTSLFKGKKTVKIEINYNSELKNL